MVCFKTEREVCDDTKAIDRDCDGDVDISSIAVGIGGLVGVATMAGVVVIMGKFWFIMFLVLALLSAYAVPAVWSWNSKQLERLCNSYPSLELDLACSQRRP